MSVHRPSSVSTWTPGMVVPVVVAGREVHHKHVDPRGQPKESVRILLSVSCPHQESTMDRRDSKIWISFERHETRRQTRSQVVRRTLILLSNVHYRGRRVEGGWTKEPLPPVRRPVPHTQLGRNPPNNGSRLSIQVQRGPQD